MAGKETAGRKDPKALFSRRDSWQAALFILLMVSVLFFHYPLMMFLQHQDPEMADYGSFSITTSRGALIDTNWFVTDILSVNQNPGLFLKDPVTYEHMHEDLPLQGAFPFYMHALLFTMLKNPTATMILGSVISTAIAAFLIFLLSRLVFRAFSVRPSWWTTSFFIAWFFTMPHILFDSLALLTGKPFFNPYIGYAGRFINTNHVMIFLLAWFILLFLLLTRRKDDGKWWLPITVGASLAVLQYSYVYYYTSALVFTAIAVAITGIFSAKKISGISGKALMATAKTLFIVYATWLLLVIPYAINFVRFSLFNKEFTVRAGADFSGAGWPGTAAFLLVIGVILLFFATVNIAYSSRPSKKKDDALDLEALKASALEISLFISMVVVLNLQLVLGYTVQAFHWPLTFGIQVMNLLFFIAFVKFIAVLRRLGKRGLRASRIILRRAVPIITVLLLLLTCIRFSYAAYCWYDYYYMDSSEEGLYNFIKQETPQDAVFFADTSYLTENIAANTQRRTLLGHMLHSKASVDEISSRLVFGYRALGLTWEDLSGDVLSSLGFPDHMHAVHTFALQDHDFRRNNLFFYYCAHYETDREGVHDAVALLKDLAPVFAKDSQDFRLDYIVFSRDLDAHRSDKGTVFQNDRYIVVKR